MPTTYSFWFQTFCRLLVFCLAFQSLHPAALSVPKALDLKLSYSEDSRLWTLDSRLFSLNFGPAPAYGQQLDPLLAPTPEFDLEDPFIINKAAELNHDPVQIFAFMRDEIGYEAYQGSLRGARGTLWSKAGNALDQASLMIALLRASGIKARYVKATLGTAEAQEVILSMFPPVLRIVGCPPADALKADPANDPTLLAEATDHYWVEYSDGFTPADPTFPNASIGQTFASKQSDFTEVPDNLRHKVTVRLKAERRVEAAIAFGGQSEVNNVLNESFITATLVGKPLSVGHFVNSKPTGGLAFSIITHTYSPHILIGQNDGSIEDDEIIRGTDYQEVITNFPLGNQLLTGLFLEMDVKSPDGTVETHERALVDRIGFAARHNSGTSIINLSGGAADQPTISPLDIVTASVEVSPLDRAIGATQEAEFARIKTEALQLSQLLEGKDPASFLPTDQETAGKLSLVNTNLLAVFSQMTATSFAFLSHDRTQQLAMAGLARAYLESPRITLVSTKVFQAGGIPSLELAMDLRKDDIRAIAFPGQISEALAGFNLSRGVSESTLEDALMSSISLAGTSEVSLVRKTSTIQVFQAAQNLGVDLTIIGSGNLASMASLNFSEEAKIRISKAVSDGRIVFVPERKVSVEGRDTIAWFEVDPTSGVTQDVGEDGTHVAIIEYHPILPGPGSAVEFTINLFLDLDSKPCETQICRKQSVFLDIYFINLLTFPGLLGSQGLLFGIALQRLLFVLPGLNWAFVLAMLIVTDPPLPLFFVQPTDDSSVSFSDGVQPGVSAQIVVDKLFTIPIGVPEAVLSAPQLPSAYRVQIKNTGPSTDTFRITLPPAPSGYTLQSSVPEITVPPGQTAEVGLCLRPINSIGAPGTAVPFDVTVTSTTDPAVTALDSETFVTPDVHGVTLTLDPAFASASPGSSVPVELAITAAGNVSENVTLSADLPNGATLNGLPSNVSLAQGETKTFPLTLNVSNSAALNSTLTTTITATFGPASPQQTSTTSMAVQAVAAHAKSAVDASLAAVEAGRSGLGSTLNALASALTALSQDPSNEQFQSRVVAFLNSLINQLNAPALTPFIADVTTIRNAIASGNPSEIQNALNSASSVIGTRLTTRVQAPKNTGVDIEPGSFNIEPTQILNGSDFDTLVWERSLVAGRSGETYTWRMRVNDLQPGEAREVTLKTTVDFTVSSGDSEQIELPPLIVASEQILALTPASRTVNPGATASYSLTVKNPTASPATYNLSVQGVPPSWVNLVSSVNVPAQGMTELELTLQSDEDATPSENGFVVTANANTGAKGFVHGSLILEGVPDGGGPGNIGEDVESPAFGVVLGLTPSQATAGQGTAAIFTVRVTNVGNEVDTYTLSGSFPSGFTGTFEESQVMVLPGLGNFREVTLTVTPPPGASVGNHAFTVRATSTNDASVQDDAAGSVNVVSQGVDVDITPSSGGPTTTFQLTVKNTGQSQDTFDLQLGGPVGVTAALGTSSVTLAPSTSQTVPITLGSLNFALSGGLDLIGVATSQANAAVKDQDSAQVLIGASKGLSVSITPAVVELPTPGDAAFLVQVNNSGNGEDAYTAEIIGTTGPVTAALSGLNRQPTQQIDTFRLPGLSTGGLLLNATLTAAGEGKVTVQVTSLSDPTITASAIATVRTPQAANQPPVAHDQSVSTPQDTPVNITLTASDPDSDQLMYSVVDPPSKGVLSGTAPNLTYLPNPGETGADSFPFKVNDGQVDSNIATVSITINATSTCGVCTGPEVVVDTAIELNATNLAGTAGVLAPFASFDGQTITIDLGNRPLRVTSTGRLSVPAAATFHPPAFHKAGNHSSPNLRIQSTCDLFIDDSMRGQVQNKFRSLTGVIETNALGGKAGDIALAFTGLMTIHGGVQSFQERLPDAVESLSGAITLQSQCGDIHTGPASWIVTWGENPGSGAITIESTGGDMSLDGLVLNRTNHTVGANEPPLINVIARDGAVTINGGNLVLDEWTVMGTRYDVTSGLLTLSRVAADVGRITVQASGDITIAREVADLTLNRQNFAAVATMVNSNTPQGGEIRLRSLAGSIQVKDRALQANGRSDNAAALIELIADQDILIESPTVVDQEHTPTITTAADPVNGVGKGGTNILQACDGDVEIAVGTEILAPGLSEPGVNEFTADDGAVNILGLVEPPPVTGPPCNNPEPLL